MENGTENKTTEQTKRVNPHIRIPADMAEKVDHYTQVIGIPRNAFYVIGLAMIVAKLAGMVETKENLPKVIKALRDEVNSTFDHIIESLNL